jgi:hypothetical protein
VPESTGLWSAVTAALLTARSTNDLTVPQLAVRDLPIEIGLSGD